MDEMEQTNKMKILKELQKNGRASASEIAKKLGLSRQTVAKIISNLEKNQEIWGYSAIFDSKLLNKKQFIFLIKLDLSADPKEFLKKAIDSNLIKQNEKKYGFKTTFFLHGNYDFMILAWAKDLIDAKKLLTTYKKIFKLFVVSVDLFEIMSSFRVNGVANPKMVEEWTNLLV